MHRHFCPILVKFLIGIPYEITDRKQRRCQFTDFHRASAQRRAIESQLKFSLAHLSEQY
jgi:hypothetical protein